MRIARHAIRAVRALARDGRIPRPLRGLAVFGVLPIPGPLDEIALLVVALILVAFYRDLMGEAWASTTDEGASLTGQRDSDLAGPTR